MTGPVFLGLDPGLRATGWGVVMLGDDQRLRPLGSGTFRPRPADPLGDRLQAVEGEIARLVENFRPDEAAIETVFAGAGIAAAFRLGEARAACLIPLARAGLATSEYAPRTVKKAVTGTGKADKHQIRLMVSKLLPGASPDSEHAADALAIAICHIHMRPPQSRTQTQ